MLQTCLFLIIQVFFFNMMTSLNEYSVIILHIQIVERSVRCYCLDKYTNVRRKKKNNETRYSKVPKKSKYDKNK